MIKPKPGEKWKNRKTLVVWTVERVESGKVKADNGSRYANIAIGSFVRNYVKVK
jgi:hypothetical protein